VLVDPLELAAHLLDFDDLPALPQLPDEALAVAHALEALHHAARRLLDGSHGAFLHEGLVRLDGLARGVELLEDGRERPRELLRLVAPVLQELHHRKDGLRG
jgi:hypothetical protein